MWGYPVCYYTLEKVMAWEEEQYQRVKKQMSEVFITKEVWNDLKAIQGLDASEELIKLANDSFEKKEKVWIDWAIMRDLMYGVPPK